MIKQLPSSSAFVLRKAFFALAFGAALIALSDPSFAQNGDVREYGEVPGVEGKAQVTVTVEKGNYATLIAVARVSGGKPVGEGVITRAGVGVDIYVDDEICTADRDIRRQIDVQVFTDKFATSATCMTILKPGTHVILAERTSINVEGAKMKLTYSVLGGKPNMISTVTE
jgi:hypothetical protein